MSEKTRRQIGATLVLLACACFIVGALMVGLNPPFFRAAMAGGYILLGSMTWLLHPLGRWQKLFIAICAFNVALYLAQLIWHF